MVRNFRVEYELEGMRNSVYVRCTARQVPDVIHKHFGPTAWIIDFDEARPTADPLNPLT